MDPSEMMQGTKKLKQEMFDLAQELYNKDKMFDKNLNKDTIIQKQ